MKEEKEELRDRTGHSRYRKTNGVTWGKKWTARERGLEPGFLFYPGKRGRTGRKKDPGESSSREEHGTRTGMG